MDLAIIGRMFQNCVSDWVWTDGTTVDQCRMKWIPGQPTCDNVEFYGQISSAKYGSVEMLGWNDDAGMKVIKSVCKVSTT